jgi:hypothetical protein
MIKPAARFIYFPPEFMLIFGNRPSPAMNPKPLKSLLSCAFRTSPLSDSDVLPDRQLLQATVIRFHLISIRRLKKIRTKFYEEMEQKSFPVIIGRFLKKVFRTKS